MDFNSTKPKSEYLCIEHCDDPFVQIIRKRWDDTETTLCTHDSLTLEQNAYKDTTLVKDTL